MTLRKPRVERLTWLLVGSTLLFFVLWLAAWAGPRDYDTERTGSFAEVAAGVGTSIALLVSFRLLSLEQSRRRDEAWDRRAVQARKVAGWVERRFQVVGGWVADVRVINRSDEPIHSLTVIVHLSDGGEHREVIGFVPPWHDETRSLSLSGEPKTVQAAHGDTEIEFRDAAAVEWRRDSEGRLSEHAMQTARRVNPA